MTTLYTYHCCDGIVRTRCRRHIHRTGPYRPIRLRSHIRTEENADPLRCFACMAEAFAPPSVDDSHSQLTVHH